MAGFIFRIENPFDDRNISQDKLLGFTTDHVQRMVANNASHELDARIAATQSSLGLVNTNISADDVSMGVRKARKQAKDDYRAGLAARYRWRGGYR